MYNFAEDSTDVNLLEDVHPVVASAMIAKPCLPTVLKGDKNAKIATKKPARAYNKSRLPRDTLQKPSRTATKPRETSDTSQTSAQFFPKERHF